MPATCGGDSLRRRSEPVAWESPLFRSDIRGVRALAVMAVLLYHFRIPGFSAGYAGVDVFFVVSGYLMTGILVADLERGRASVWRFYGARARRIVPALAVCCLALLGVGWMLLLPDDYALLARHALSSLGFVSNYVYLGESGYFDHGATDKWLLHTWSLSVEWQFYLLLPLLLFACWRWRPSRPVLAAVHVIGMLASLVLMLAVPDDLKASAFFLLPMRAWELLCGGSILLMTPSLRDHAPVRRALGLAGVSGLVAILPVAAPAAAWPGCWTMLPVLATAAILISDDRSPAWLGGRVLGWIGDRSYSLYLWHWPVATILIYLDASRPWHAGAGIALSFILAHASYHAVEQPFRAGRSRRSGVALGLLFVLALGSSAWVVMRMGVPGRMPVEAERAAAESGNRFSPLRQCERSPEGPWDSCRYGQGPIGAILIGDSHADAVASSLAQAVIEQGGSLQLFVYPSCPTLIGAKWLPGVFRAGQHCEAFNRWVMQRVDEIASGVPVVLVARSSAYLHGVTEPWEDSPRRPAIYFSEPHAEVDAALLAEYQHALDDTLCHWSPQRPVFQFRPIPEMSANAPRAIARALMRGDRRAPWISLAEYRARHATVIAAQDKAAARCGTRILDPLPYLCDTEHCHAGADGRPWYYDDDHLSEFGNRRLLPMFREVTAAAPR